MLLYNSACKKATTTVFMWGDRGYTAVHFENKTASVFWQNWNSNFFQKHPNIVKTDLYSKQTAGYPLSPHIKLIAVALLQAEI